MSNSKKAESGFKNWINNLQEKGHITELNKTMGSTQSIHIVDGVRYGYADLRRPNASVSAQITN